VGLACFTITDVYLVEGDTISDPVTTGLRYGGDVYNPPAPGCNKIPCGLGTNNVPETNRLAVDVEAGAQVGLQLHIENTSFAGRMGFEFRYGDNPQFGLGPHGFVVDGFSLGTVVPVVKDADQIRPTATLTLSPSFTANATIQVYFIVDESSFGGSNSTIFYQCVDLTVAGNAPLPSWAPDFGPKEQTVYNADPAGNKGYDCSLDPRCRPYVPKLSDWDWLIILCVLSLLVLCVCICIACLCCRRQPKTVVSPPPEPPPPQEEVIKELTPSGSHSKPSPYAHFAFTDPNDPPSKKGADSGSTGDRNTGSQGRHFHFHYEEAEPGDPNKDEVVVVRP